MREMRIIGDLENMGKKESRMPAWQHERVGCQEIREPGNPESNDTRPI